MATRRQGRRRGGQIRGRIENQRTGGVSRRGGGAAVGGRQQVAMSHYADVDVSR